MTNLSARIAGTGLGVTLFLLAASGQSQAPSIPVAGEPRVAGPLPFSPGEKLTFDLSWDIFTAGQIEATVSRVEDTPVDSLEVKATARSRGFVSLLYAVDDEYDSYINAQTFCSERITKKVSEGRRHKDTKLVFDGQRRQVVLDERDLARPSLPPKHDVQPIPACVGDVISSFYDIRRRPLKVGEVIALPINDGSKTTDVRVEVQAIETIKVPFGQRRAYRLEPTVFGGLLRRRGRMLIWIGDDPERLPLRIKAIISVGTITAELRSVSNRSASGPIQAPPPAKP